MSSNTKNEEELYDEFDNDYFALYEYEMDKYEMDKYIAKKTKYSSLRLFEKLKIVKSIISHNIVSTFSSTDEINNDIVEYVARNNNYKYVQLIFDCKDKQKNLIFANILMEKYSAFMTMELIDIIFNDSAMLRNIYNKIIIKFVHLDMSQELVYVAKKYGYYLDHTSAYAELSKELGAVKRRIKYDKKDASKMTDLAIKNIKYYEKKDRIIDYYYVCIKSALYSKIVQDDTYIQAYNLLLITKKIIQSESIKGILPYLEQITDENKIFQLINTILKKFYVEVINLDKYKYNDTSFSCCIIDSTTTVILDYDLYYVKPRYEIDSTRYKYVFPKELYGIFDYILSTIKNITQQKFYETIRQFKLCLYLGFIDFYTFLVKKLIVNNKENFRVFLNSEFRLTEKLYYVYEIWLNHNIIQPSIIKSNPHISDIIQKRNDTMYYVKNYALNIHISSNDVIDIICEYIQY